MRVQQLVVNVIRDGKWTSLNTTVITMIEIMLKRTLDLKMNALTMSRGWEWNTSIGHQLDLTVIHATMLILIHQHNKIITHMRLLDAMMMQ